MTSYWFFAWLSFLKRKMYFLSWMDRSEVNEKQTDCQYSVNEVCRELLVDTEFSGFKISNRELTPFKDANIEDIESFGEG